MATETENVSAWVEPDIKEQAEEILARLGVPAPVAIDMLYRQIIFTRSIPFPLKLPAASQLWDEMD